MRRLMIPLSTLMILVLISGMVGCGVSSDEAQIIDLMKQQETAFNNKDWQTYYDTMSPNYKRTCTYNEYREFNEEAWEQLLPMLGTGQMKITDIDVRVEEEWAYATLKMLWNGEEIFAYTSSYPDIYRKVNGVWYDVTEELIDPGYNTDDLP